MMGRMTRPAIETGETWTLPLPYQRPVLTYNQLNGKHWSTAKAARETLHEAAFYLSRQHKLPRPFTVPVTIELVYWPGTNRANDADGLGPTLKYLIDGLRKAGVITDDRGRYVRSAICTVIEKDDDPEARAGSRLGGRMSLILRSVDDGDAR
jgi:Holliday junction resolvase RusA-like endonuclease